MMEKLKSKVEKIERDESKIGIEWLDSIGRWRKAEQTTWEAFERVHKLDYIIRSGHYYFKEVRIYIDNDGDIFIAREAGDC